MIKLFEAAWEFHQFFAENRIPYVIIGGLAVQHWGQPRSTRDVDFTISVPIEETESTVKKIADQFSPRIDRHLDFALKNRILLVQSSNGINIDIALALPGYEDELITRAIELELEPGKVVNLCSPEDLLIHKAVARRIQDQRDIETIIARNGPQLNIDYIRHWLRIFSDILETSEVINSFEIPYARWQTRS